MEQNGLELPLYSAPIADASRDAVQHIPATEGRKSWWEKCKTKLDLTRLSLGHFTRFSWTGAINHGARTSISGAKLQSILKRSEALA